MPGFVIELLQMLDLQWAAEQAGGGNMEPFLWWTAAVFALGCAVGYSTSRHRAKNPVKFVFMRRISRDVAGAMLAALDAGGMIPMGRFSKAIMGVHDEGLRVFIYSDPWECVGSGSEYQITSSWRGYLKRPWNRRKLEKMANR